ncbi:MAG: S41 family peptidase, partial [Candidatus Gastranaerophilales bacterium]|nr:S41 family peptidase [Candidatus Gastranaerophilales bacterium]
LLSDNTIMNQEIQRKNIIFYTIFAVITVIVLNLILKPENYTAKDYISNFLQTFSASQNIAPQRLYVNVWRTAKNSYFDETLNNQDWSRWRYKYSKYIKTQEDASIAINTMLMSLNDPYTKFLLSDIFKKQKIMMESKIYGIGIMFTRIGNEIFVRDILNGSPAQLANITPGDTVISINGISTKNIDTDELAEIIQNSKMDEIEITCMKNGIIKTEKLKKQDIYLPTMNYKITKDNIGIITLSNIMGEKAVNDFKYILDKTNDTRAIIIDLRNNYGGILANAIQMANYMLDEDKILSIKSRINSEYQIYSANERIFKRKPIFILINHNTASAAEILAGTLKDNLNAILIGEKSYGKNSIQHVYPMTNGSGLILTTDKYIFPSGLDIYQKGLTPDIEIKEEADIVSINDKQFKKAMEIIREIVKKD